MQKVIIAGSRTFRNYAKLERECDNILFEYLKNETEIEIVSGAQVSIDPITKEKYGADYYGEIYGKECGFSVKRFPANWYKYGKSGGPRRNETMSKYADMLILFWDGSSKGSKSMLDYAKKENLIIHIIKY